MLTSYAIENGWDIYKIYSDEDISGIRSNRPEYVQLLRDAQDRKFHIVLCKEQSRFTRDMVEVDKYIHNKFPQWGIRFISIVDHVDTNIKGSKKTRQIYALTNEWYLEDVSENIRATLNSKKKRGEFIGAFAPYGYLKDPLDKSHLIVDPEASRVIRRIFDMYLSGMSHLQIARTLNKEKIPSPLVYMQDILGLNFKIEVNRVQTKMWSSGSISRILNNQTYAGDMVQSRHKVLSYKNPKQIRQKKEDWIVVPDTHEAIIDRDKFAVIAELAGKKIRPDKTGRTARFGGKLRCAECGGTLSKSSAKDHKTKQYKLIIYRCNVHCREPELCAGSSIAEHNLEKYAAEELRKIIGRLTTEGDIAALVEIEKKQENRIKSLRIRADQIKKDLARREKALSGIYMDKLEGTIESSEYSSLRSVFTAEIKSLKERIASIEKELDAAGHDKAERQEALEQEKAKHELVKKYRNITSLTRELVVELIDHIVIKNVGWRSKSIEIFWRF